MGWDGGGGGDGFQRYGPNIMKRPAFFQSEALRLREPICRLQYCPYPKRTATVLGRISRFLSPSLGAVVARLLLFSIFLFFSLNCETCNAFRWEKRSTGQKRNGGMLIQSQPYLKKNVMYSQEVSFLFRHLFINAKHTTAEQTSISNKNIGRL